MQKIADTPFYKNAFQELNYSFGDFYLFEDFVVAEIKEGVVFNWEDHAKQVVEEIVNLYEDNVDNIVYISNRVHTYSVVPSDWLRFFKYSYSLKGYAVVSHGKRPILEKLFMKATMKNFVSLDKAIKWAYDLRARHNDSSNKLSA